MTQSQAVGAAGLELLGVAGAYALTDPGNAVTTLAGATGSATYSQSGALTIGTVGSTAGLATTGPPWVTTGGDRSPSPSGATVSGAPRRVLAATGAFINNRRIGGGHSEFGALAGLFEATPALTPFGNRL